MADEQVVFDNTVDALFRRALGSKLTPEVRQRIKTEAGIDLDKLKPSYPRLTYYKAVAIAAEELYRGVPTERAMEQLGIAFIDGFQETLMGRTVVSVVKMLGPKRSLARMTQNFRSSNNYMMTELIERGPTEFEMSLSETSGYPTYFVGVLYNMLIYSGAKNPRVQISQFDGHRAVLRIRWDPK